VILWFLGVSIIPFLTLLTTYKLNSNVYTLTGFVGYFVLGIYLLTVQMRRSTFAIFMILVIALTVFGTCVLTATVGGTEMYFFQEYFNPTVIFGSVMVFLLLLTIQPHSIQKRSNLPKSINSLK
jgi:hypothetical protein